MKQLAASVVIIGLLAGCAHKNDPPIRIETKEIVIEKPVPCGAFDALGEEPSYPDTDEALEEASNIGALAKLYRNGRAMRNARLSEYQTARRSCEALETIGD